MDSATKDEMQPSIPPGSSCPGPEWPEQERAEQLARGAALKWASGIFYRPEQLARLSQYRSREVQRTCSLEARIKSVVQSYLEGVKIGVWQLAQASEAVQAAREALGQAHGLLQGLAEATQTLKPLREQVAQHKQLQVLSQLLPRLWAVPAAVAHTRTLIDAQQLLEAYACLRELEQLQEETWAPLGGLELPVFEALGPLAEALGRAVEVAAGAAGQLAREDPALLVAAVRIAEVDAGYTPSLELTPRDWRQRCLQALQEGLERTHFGTPLLLEPGALKGWLEALRVALPAELATAEALVAPCCPPHYKVVQLWTHTLHHGLRRCLQQLLEGPELGASDAFTLLHWALHVYQGPEMMGSLELGPEADVSQLEPLLTLENIEQLEATFVAQIQANVAQWLQNALDGEVAEWNREQEPGTDSSGFYHSPMPAIVLQILEENIRVTSLVSESLQQRMHAMALSELGTFLRSFSDALIRFSRDHVRGEAMAPHYVPYLLATLNHQSALSSSVSVLQPDGVASGALAPVEAALDELQRRICRLVLEALLAELQVRLQVGMGVGGRDSAYTCVLLCRRNARSGCSSSPVSAPHPAAPVHGSALAPVAFEPRAAGRRVQEDGTLLPGFRARAESCGPAAPGRGGTYGGSAVPACADAGPPGVPRRGREDPGGRAPAARRGPASGALPRFGPGGECSVRARAPRSSGSAEPPRPHATWPRGGRPATKIS
uniref:exocyst complex component 3-like protein isoform X2 n=1 Tax=Nyctereutes procyonoides TaxID=34880 RepID=UPI002443F357|nr:exocyst complex component 3-like protein isoform X2 [Nyctereutes procyonoides]